jgi:hypothetical protein
METPVSDGNSAAAPAAPTSFAEAYATVASSATDTPDQSSTPAAAETPPTDQGAAPADSDERSPFIPRARFDEVNTDRNSLKQWKEQYAWAEQIPREQLTAAMDFYGQFNGADPIAALQQLAQRLQDHPEHGPKLKSFAARALAQARQPQTPQPAGPDYSQIVVDLGNGQQISLADFESSVLAKAEQKFGPALKTVEQYAAERKQADQQREVSAFSTRVDSALKELIPNYDDVKADISTELRAMQIKGDDPRDVEIATLRAAMKVAFPKLGSKAQSQLLDTLQQKAAANTSVNPGSAASSVPSDIRSFHDKRLQWS